MRNKKRLSSEKKKWEEEKYADEIKKHPERKPLFETPSHIPLHPLYTPLDFAEGHYLQDVGFPGSFPFTRGVYPTMYRVRPWTIRQYAGFGTAEETNRRFHFLLEKGQKGLSVAFDLPTQMGLDSDDPLSRGEVGRVGVAVDSLEDMRVLFEGIPLDRISTSMTINSTAPILLAMYVALAEENGVDKGRISGTVQNDVLKEYIARGTFIFPPGPSVRLITDTFSWCSQHLPNWNPISISGYHIREAGATAVQELALTLANAVCYVEAGLRAGLQVDDFAPRLSFFFSVHNHFLEEVAKFRAARLLWARIMRDRFKAQKEESMRLRFHTQTAGSTLGARQVENNIVRVTIQALAAVLGGTQSLHTNSLDEALGLPSEAASRIALRTQQIILEESGVTDTIDPLGGSYLIESLTREIATKTEMLLEKIDEMGGMVKAIEEGYPQREIERSSYSYQKALEEKKVRIVGVNVYTDAKPEVRKPLEVDPRLEEQQVSSLRKTRASRDDKRVTASLQAIESAARTGDNLMPCLLEAVKNLATVGEICRTLSSVFGRYRQGRNPE